MLSKKMTFSLMSLLTLLAFAFVAGDAFAAAKPFEIKIMGRAAVSYDPKAGGQRCRLMLTKERLPLI